ncbi:MAG TPA: PDZ domain-containing protein [Acidimicrobiales bacterium]|nr:PDZ domain-containing protein [Acidimicrobiales bacterium]
MEGPERDDGFEVTFVVSTPRSEAWRRLVDIKQDDRWWIPGVESTAEELAVTPASSLRVRKAEEPCKGTEIVMTFEDADTGTRITFVQHGFGPFFGEARPWLEAGWWAIRADLFVFFEHGVRPMRHARPWADLGCDVSETPGGLVVRNVRAGGFAADAGLVDGDLVLLLANSPVVNVHELSAVSRSLLSGDHVRVRWLRDGSMMSGTGTV